MDEPLSNLDAKLRVSMRAELARLHTRLGVTTVYVTHDQVEAMTLGDRVCVMLDGTIQQVDTPTRLYQAPVNTFVAAAIGSPSMNLAVADVADGSVAFGEYRLPLPTALRAAVGDRRQVIIGLRPTDFRLRAADFALEEGAPPTSVARLAVTADIVEQLGAEQMVVFPVNVARYVPPGTHAGALIPTGGADDEETLLAEPQRSRFTARLDMRRTVRHGENVELWFDTDRLYVFDPETGDAISAAPAAGSTNQTATPEPAIRAASPAGA
jgi:multiple sugar transport system ATP-binding protein